MSSVSAAKRVEVLRDKLIDTRRDLHMHPELSGQEVRTSGIVAERLGQLDLDNATSRL